MQFPELFILLISVGFYNIRHEKSLERNAVIRKIGNQQFMYVFGKCREIFVYFENVYRVRFHCLCDVGLDSCH